jgi:hypothetical protein
MSDPYANKPCDYHARRQWQNAQRAAGLVPECGREVCRCRCEPAYVNSGTPLLYCPDCAQAINRYNPRLCTPEVTTD